MKKPLINLFLFLLILGLAAYDANAQTYEIDQYNGQTITNQCAGTFSSSNAVTVPANTANFCFSNATQYGDNENYSTTICTNTGDSTYFNFSFFEIIPGDTLYIYKVTAGGDVLMYKLTGPNAVPSTFGIQNECVKFVFISNATDHGAQGGGGAFDCAVSTGWKMDMSCVVLPKSCNGNPPAGDLCSNAAAICDFSGYCGNTSSYYQIDIPTGFCDNCSSLFTGSIENNSWLKFVASSSTASFDVNTTQCTGTGVQMGIYSSSSPCSGNWTLHSDITYTGNAQNSFTITASNLVAGNTYYIMIDGYNGAVCNYEVKANDGIGSITAGNDTTITCGDITTLTGHGALSGSGAWTSNPSDPSLVVVNDSVINIAPIVTTDYIYSGGVGNPMCSGSGLDTIRVTVNPPTSTFIINPTTICAGDSTKISYTGNANGGTFTWNFDGGIANPGTGAGPHWVSWTTPGVHNVTLSVAQGACTSNSANTITVLHDTICNITCSSTKTDKTQCGGSPCNYSGPTILINEVMLMPNLNDGCIYGSGGSGTCEGEWIELFNPDACNAIDISCYFLGNNAYDGGATNIGYHGGGFALPVGTIVPPLGFAVVRGQNATSVPSSLLVQNGGNTVEIVINSAGRVCIDGGDRLWFPNLGGWFAFYDENGVVQDAITWKDPNNINFDLTQYNTSLSGIPCNPTQSGCSFSGSLSSYNAIPAAKKNLINTGTTTQGQSYRRIPDGGSWSVNSSASPTIGNCNSTCITPPTVTCDGKATVSVSGGTGSFSYNWDNGGIAASVNDLCAGQHYVTITDINNGATCVSTVTIEDPLPPSSNFTITPNVCIGSNANAVPDENLPNGTYNWNFGGGTSNSAPTSISKDVNFPAEGSYNVSLSIVDKNCPSDTTEKTVNVYPKPTSDFIATRNDICAGDTTLLVYSGNASTSATYNWDFSGGTAVTGVGIGPHVISWESSEVHTVYLYVTENGCPSDTTEVSVNIRLCDVTIPNVFTPNGDGINDYFYVTNLEYFQNTNCIVFNRWGKKVYENSNYQNNWDGGDVTDGVYYYILEFANGRLKTMSGSVTVIRDGK
ncbi:MAG: gliding motility-associated C-terminal domain-containing protein [Bacteroidota bacterium]